ncbi:MAG TPA: polyprenyl synthetase family protein [Methanomassiliicoccales archaeon]|nr:polyprenyl synthetase family protein [Methanomassiliicoccales archaeon]HQQ24832.1 polyprenyl synthetase family protein [Methanomassiliicoccales archaeon]
MDHQQRTKEMIKEIDRALMKYVERGKHEKLIKAMRHYPEAGGKRMRPVMAMLVAEAVGKRGKEALPFGCSLELIHNFTLVHDDVIDKDPVRRGRPAVHIAFDEPTAIIAGDALFAIAYDVLAMTDVDGERLRRLLRAVSDTVFLVAEGQQMDVDNEDRPTVSKEEYLDMVEKKTAVLFACAAEGGAIIGHGTEKQITDMKEYARLLGIGFQIWDDVLGIKGDAKKVGKPIGSDIRNGKRTLIVLDALERLEKDQRKHVLTDALGNEKATDEQVRAAIKLLEDIGSIENARQFALDYAKRAKDLLSCLKDSEEKEMLREMVDYAVGREL